MTINTQRRYLMKALSAAGISFNLPASASTAPDPWEQAQAIVDRLSKPLAFRKQDFDVTSYGARTCQVAKVKGWISFEDQDMIDKPVAGSSDCYAAFKAGSHEPARAHR